MNHKAYVYYTNGEVTAWKDLDAFINYFRDTEGVFNTPDQFLIVTEFNSKSEASHYDRDELLAFANESETSDYDEHNTKWGL